MGSIIGGFMGMQEGRRAADRADGLSNQALGMYNNIELPSIESQQVDFQLPEYLGDLTAGQESAQSLGPSNFEGIATDPRLMDAQMSALDQLSQMGESGLLPGEEAALRQARRSSASEAQAKSGQLMDEYARRGMGGSGAELAARLQAGQSSADRQSQESDRAMQMAQERALNSISQKGALAGNINSQQFQQQADVAKAKDYINQFNTQNQQSVQQRNVAAANAANARNVDTKQVTANNAANVRNQQESQNKGLIQQNFNNQIAKTGGAAGVLGQQAQTANQRGANAAQSYAQMGAGLDQIGTAFLAPKAPVYQYGGPKAQSSDENAKKNIHSIDVNAFLDKLVPYGYEYKDPAHGEGKQMGVMAQDLEQTEPGKHLVKDTPDGKIVDYSQAGGTIFASLADLHQRLKSLEGK